VWGLLDQRSPVFGYVDGPRFIASPTFRAILEAVREVQAQRPGAPDPLTELTRTCGFDPLRAVRELAFTADPRTEEVTFVAALDGKAERAFSCFESVGKPEPASLAGRTALCREEQCLVAQDDLLLFGRRAKLEKLFAAFPEPSGTPPAEDYLFVTGEFPNPFGVERASFTMAPASAGTRLRLVAQAGSPERAAELEAQARQLLAVVPERLAAEPPELQRIAKTLLQNLTLEQQGNTATATLTVEDATLAGSLSALAVYGVKRYLVAAKTAEARETIAEIAARLIAYSMEARDHRFPRSAPSVPKQIPAGIKYTSTRADWQHKSWTAIEFSREGGQYYSYEYETSKDGKRATVRARGDLDGDGVQSLFELDLTADGGEARTTPTLRETNPTE
jgi:type IV pilus assembly protein PilA